MKQVWNVKDLSCRKFPQEDRHHIKSHLKLPSKKTHTIGKTIVKPCLLKTAKQRLGELSEANIKRISFPAILFRSTFQNVGRCERPGDKWNDRISNSNAFFQVDESTDVNSCAQLLVFVRFHSGDIKRGVPVLWGTANYSKCRCSRDVKIVWFCRVAVEILLWLLLLCKMCWIPR